MPKVNLGFLRRRNMFTFYFGLVSFFEAIGASWARRSRDLFIFGTINGTTIRYMPKKVK